MAQIRLQELDVNNLADQQFTYDIIKYRWSKADTINIKYKTPTEMPTFEQHVQVLKSDRYKKLYKIFLSEFPLGMIYIDKNNVTGHFMLPGLARKALRVLKSRKEEVDLEHLTLNIHVEMYRMHPEITVYYATVNPKNTLSLRALLNNGYEHIETVLVMTTKDGVINQGPWKKD